jgi:hypothetical protein
MVASRSETHSLSNEHDILAMDKNVKLFTPMNRYLYFGSFNAIMLDLFELHDIHTHE